MQRRTRPGQAQEEWLFEELARDPARWRLIALQVMITPPAPGLKPS